MNDKEMQAEASAVVGETIRTRQRNKTHEQLVFEAWAKKHTNFNQEKAEKEFAESIETEKRELYEKELSALKAAAKFQEQFTEESYKLFFATLTPVVVSDEQTALTWLFRFEDEVTGEKSPTLKEIAKEKYFNLGDRTAITDKQAFTRDVARRFNGAVLEWTLDRHKSYSSKDVYDADKYAHSTQRYFTARFMLRARYPPKQ